MVDYVTNYASIKTTLRGLAEEDYRVFLKDDMVLGFFQDKEAVGLDNGQTKADRVFREQRDKINFNLIQTYGFVDEFEPDLIAVQRSVDSVFSDEDLEEVFYGCPRIKVLKRGDVPCFRLREEVLFHKHLSELSKISIEDARDLIDAYNFYMTETGLTRNEFVNYCNLVRRYGKDIKPLPEDLARRIRNVK